MQSGSRTKKTLPFSNSFQKNNFQKVVGIEKIMIETSLKNIKSDQSLSDCK